jgi:hypothetical protein
MITGGHFVACLLLSSAAFSSLLCLLGMIYGLSVKNEDPAAGESCEKELVTNLYTIS